MNEEFAFLILEIVSEVPYGKVVSYSQLATIAGYPKNARKVGKVLANADFFGNYPCHRVVHNDGSLTPQFLDQKSLLELEGVKFKGNKVNMDAHRWNN